MTQVSMELVKKLRAKTAVGLMDCRKALIEANGDLEKAITILRKKGAAIAAKRAEQETNEGVIEAYISDDHHAGSLVAIACETDFAANTGDMREFVKSIAETATQANQELSVDQVMQSVAAQNTLTVQETLDELMAKISESIKVASVVSYQTDNTGFVQGYVHPGSRLGALVELRSANDTSPLKEDLAKLGRDISMQIAVTAPLAIDSSGLDQQVVEKERTFFSEQLAAAGKPADMIDKIITGKMNKFYEDVCLLNQKFIKDEKKTISGLLEEFGKQHNTKVTVSRFNRFAIGK